MPAFVWSEEYQRELFSKHFKAFDILRRYGWFIGEFIWNFADFKTNQGKYRKPHEGKYRCAHTNFDMELQPFLHGTHTHTRPI